MAEFSESSATFGENHFTEALDKRLLHLSGAQGGQKAANVLSKHFSYLTSLARASVQELLRFVSRSRALRQSRLRTPDID